MIVAQKPSLLPGFTLLWQACRQVGWVDTDATVVG